MSLISLFVSIYNCVISGSLQWQNFDYVKIRLFVVRMDYVRKQLYSNVSFFFAIVMFLLLCYTATHF